jgi:sterol desaturase/sphingolipid hydroxylase (fatty acid hydroxylase superfamily)
MPEELAGVSLLGLATRVLGFFGGMTAVALAIGFLVERALPNRKVFAVPLAKDQYRFEAIGNFVFLAVATITFTVVLASGVVRFGEATTARTAATFWAMLFGFQAFYWTLHRAMHTRRLLFIHRWHHRSKVTTPLSGQSVHPIEACFWMLGYAGLPILFSRIVPISFDGWAFYLAFNVFGNIVGHANCEPTAKLAATRLASIFANPFVYHSLHHARWTVNYAFQASIMDRLFGTEADDWEDLYARVSGGNPMTRMDEKGRSRPGGT